MQRAVIVIEKTGIIRSINHRAVNLFGYTSGDELVGKTVNNLVPSPYTEMHDKFINNYLESGIPKIIGRSRLVEGLKKNGSIISIRLAVSELKIGNETYFCGLIEEEGDKSAAVTTDEDGKILSANSSFEKLFGYAPGKSVGRNISEICAGIHEEKHAGYMENYKKTGESKVIGHPRNLKAKNAKTGKVIPITMLVNRRDEGGICTFSAVINSITDEIEAYVTINSTGIIQSVNNNLWVLFGYEKDELIGKNINVLMPQPHAELHDTYIKRYLNTRQPRVIGKGVRIVRAKHKDGSHFYIYLEIGTFNKPGDLQPFFLGKITRVLPTQNPSKSEKTSTSKVKDDDLLTASEGVKRVGNYLIKKTISDGLYGKVRLAVHQLTGQKVIVKTISKDMIQTDKYKEIVVMKKLRHPYIVRLLEVIEGVTDIFIVLQFIEGGELFEYVIGKGKISEDEARKFWRQIVSAVDYIHDRGICHRDLKLENIMLDSFGNIVIIDLGLSNFLAKGKLLSTFCGSTAYAAPEMFLCKKYKGPEVDVWSMGVILYCMVLGYLPFEDPQRIIDADPVPIDANEQVSEEFRDLINKIFVKSAKSRITIKDIRSHPWTVKGMNEECLAKYGGIAEDVDYHKDPEIMTAAESCGFAKDAIDGSLSKEEYNQITATLYLLYKQKQKATFKKEQKEQKRKQRELRKKK